MLSTALSSMGYKMPYKPSYEKHPCTVWVSKFSFNAYWLVQLATELEVIRQELDHPFHASSHVIKLAKDILEEDFPSSITVPPSPYLFPFAGPVHLALNQTLPVWEKYQRYYVLKAKDWLDKGRPMSYKGRPIPDFMQGFIQP
jgi:hypothetical protein